MESFYATRLRLVYAKSASVQKTSWTLLRVCVCICAINKRLGKLWENGWRGSIFRSFNLAALLSIAHILTVFIVQRSTTMTKTLRFGGYCTHRGHSALNLFLLLRVDHFDWALLFSLAKFSLSQRNDIQFNFSIQFGGLVKTWQAAIWFFNSFGVQKFGETCAS